LDRVYLSVVSQSGPREPNENIHPEPLDSAKAKSWEGDWGGRSSRELSQLRKGNGERILRLREQRNDKAFVVQEEDHSGTWWRTPWEVPSGYVILPGLSLQGVQDTRLELLAFRSLAGPVGEDVRQFRIPASSFALSLPQPRSRPLGL